MKLNDLFTEDEIKEIKAKQVSKVNRKLERGYYESIKEKLGKLLETNFSNFHLEITANKKFSNKLKAKISQNREVIFYFLKQAAPDITGFVEKQSSTDFVIVEVKREIIKLDYIYQARKYAELFDARYAFLISTCEIPEEIKRLSKIVSPYLLSIPAYKHLTLVHYDEQAGNFVEWFEKNPFEKEIWVKVEKTT